MANRSNSSSQQVRPEDETRACIQRYLNRGYVQPEDVSTDVACADEPSSTPDAEPTALECIQRFYDNRRD